MDANLSSTCFTATTAGACSSGYRDRDELSGDAASSGPMRKNSTRPKTFGQSHSRNFADQFRSHSSPLSWNQGTYSLSPSENDQSQLHRRNNRHRKVGSQGGKENIPPYLLCQPGKTHGVKARRAALADVTAANQGCSESFEEVSFAGSTSIHSPSRKVGNGEPGAAGLKFELDLKPFLAKSDSQETVIAKNSFVPVVIESVDRSTECRPESTHPGPSTPLREALASFNDMFSSTFTFPAKKSTTSDDPLHAFCLSFRLPASPLPTGASISDAFNISTLADSISQMTGEIAASITARYESDHLNQGQYHEDAVARDERFDWEEEMKCLEVQCGLSK